MSALVAVTRNWARDSIGPFPVKAPLAPPGVGLVFLAVCSSVSNISFHSTLPILTHHGMMGKVGRLESELVDKVVVGFPESNRLAFVAFG